MELRGLFWLRALFVGALLIAVGLTVAGIHFADGKRPDAALEIAKAGIQLAAIVVVGALVTQGLKHLDYARDDRRRLHDYRLAVFRETVDAHNRVKTARRSLRALGVLDLGGRSDRRYTIAGFDAEMRALNEAEASLERIEREIKARSRVFAHGCDEIASLAYCMEALKGVLYVWESGALVTSSRSPRQTYALNELKMFLASRSETRCDEKSWDGYWLSFSRFEAALRDDLHEPSGRPSLVRRIVAAVTRRKPQANAAHRDLASNGPADGRTGIGRG